MDIRWEHLDRLLKSKGPLGLPSAILTELATRIDEALTQRDYAQLETLTEQLRTAYDLAFQGGSEEAKRAATASLSADHPAHAAFRLGQLGMANLIASNAIRRRVGQEFVDVLQSAKYSPYVLALTSRELTGVQLAEAIDCQPETVSRNLKRLREIGAVDFRSDGTRQVNFLTPAGRQVASTMAKRVSSSKPVAPKVRDWVNMTVQREKPHMRIAPNFASAKPTVRESEPIRG